MQCVRKSIQNEGKNSEIYYSGLTDGDEVLITFSFSEQDVIEGDPETRQSEITVKKATVKSFEIL